MICPNPAYRAARDSRRVPAAIILPPHKLYVAALEMLEHHAAQQPPGFQCGAFPAISPQEIEMDRPMTEREIRRMLAQVRAARERADRPQEMPLRWFLVVLALAAVFGVAAARILHAWMAAGAPL